MSDVLNIEQAQQFIEQTWEESIIPELEKYIAIPNKSPAFDPNWQQNGYMDQAVDMMVKWTKAQQIKGLCVEVVKLEGRTPLIYIEVPGSEAQTVLLYGHLDKQPEMTGWDDDLAPWKPVRKEHKLYGRGGADDGYAIYASLTAIKALQLQNKPHARCVIIIEACEESGSADLPFYVDHLSDRIGQPDLVICLDSGAGNYKQLWSTTSLRGIVNGTLSVDIIKKGLHSGYASGVVPGSFRIIRQLLDRVENSATGEVLLPELQADIPQQRIDQAKIAADLIGEKFKNAFAFLEGSEPVVNNVQELMLNRTWRATMTLIGVGGVPTLENAGNVMRPQTECKLSFRIPPTCDAKKAAQALKATFEKDPPYGAKVVFTCEDAANGWNAPALAPWLEKVTEEASQAFYEKAAIYFGEGGSIPFMGMLGEKFPQAQFLITGVLGPNSNAHGPNEFIHLEFAKKLTGCVTYILAEHFKERCHD